MNADPSALTFLKGTHRTEDGMDGNGTERFETVIVGGGQAGLATGYHLMKRGISFVILDANQRVGDAWRMRWDSLRVFTPARYSGMPGWRFPARGSYMPTKDEIADYLEAYASRFDLPVRTGVRVDLVTRQGSRFVVIAGGRRFEADSVVVASGAHQIPRVPAFAGELDPGIVQLHSSEYRNPSQLRDGGVLLVGVGNSGADIGMEVVRDRPTWLSGKESGHIPFRIEGFFAQNVLIRVVRFVGHNVLTVRTPIGRKVRRKFQTQGGPLVRVKPKDLEAAGVERVARTAGVMEGLPLLEDGRVLDVSNVIWCTGFRRDFSWVGLPFLGEDGEPAHDRGVVRNEPGLYFVGLLFQYAATSDVLPGVGRDAEHIAKHIASHRADRLPRAGALAEA
jgi:putative flavoprotein involved in K+ transport